MAGDVELAVDMPGGVFDGDVVAHFFDDIAVAEDAILDLRMRELGQRTAGGGVAVTGAARALLAALPCYSGTVAVGEVAVAAGFGSAACGCVVGLCARLARLIWSMKSWRVKSIERVRQYLVRVSYSLADRLLSSDILL